MGAELIYETIHVAFTKDEVTESRFSEGTEAICKKERSFI